MAWPGQGGDHDMQHSQYTVRQHHIDGEEGVQTRREGGMQVFGRGKVVGENEGVDLGEEGEE